MENGRELGSLAKTARKANNKARLADAIERDIEFDGKPKTQREYAEEFGVTERTIRGWMKEIDDGI